MISLERPQQADEVTQRNFETIARLMLDPGGRSLDFRVGSSTVTWPGADANSSVLTTAHGLGKAPTYMFAQGASTFFNSSVIGVNGTANIDLRVRRVDGVIPGAGTTLTVYWLVIG